jgi:hypothetical protein
MPQTYSIEDYRRIQQARALVAGESSAVSRTSVMAEVTQLVTNRLADEGKMPKMKPEAQAEVLRLRISNSRLEKNLGFVHKAPQSDYKTTLIRHLSGAISAINDYLLHNSLTSETDDKLNTYLLKHGCPRWVYTKFSESEDPDLAKKETILSYFPKKLSKGFQLYASELRSVEFIKGLGPMSSVCDCMLAVLETYPVEDKDKDSTKLFVPPTDILRRLDQLESLPTLPRTAHKSSLVMVSLIEAIAANYTPLQLTEDVLKVHSKCFRKGEKAIKIFTAEAQDSRSLKVQFHEHVVKEAPDLFVQEPIPWEKFSLPSILKVVPFVQSKIDLPGLPVKNFYGPLTKPGTAQSALRAETEKKIQDLLPLTVAPKKRLRGGQQQLDLTKSARELVQKLRLAADKNQVHPDFVNNVSTFLRGFLLPPMMDLAVQVLTATISSREIIPEEEEHPPDWADDEGTLTGL